MENKPKISRYLIFIVIIIVLLLLTGIYFVFSSEKIVRYALNATIDNFGSNNNIVIRLDNINGCLIDGIKIDKIHIRHIKPNFEISISEISITPILENVLSKGIIYIDGSIKNVDWVGVFKLPTTVASIPPFIGYECFAYLPSNIKINSLHIDKLRLSPCESKELEIFSDNILLKANKTSDNLDVELEFFVSWKNKKLAKANFNGILEDKKNKLNGRIKLDIAKQNVVSELSLTNGKNGIEYSGYIASDTLIDAQPLSQWLGYFWQLDYPYALSGKLHCQGSWFYNSEIGFLGNLNGEYDKLTISLLGLFFSFLEFNGKWKFFDGKLEFFDLGSKLIDFPISLNGKIESVCDSNRKWNLVFIANSLQLDKLTASLPWMLKYSKGIPDLDGIATFSVALQGNRPTVAMKAEFDNLSSDLPKANSLSNTIINGKSFYYLPETGSGTLNLNFNVLSEKGLPLFFKRFSNNFYVNENKSKLDTIYNYSINGALNEQLKLKGTLKIGENKTFETTGEMFVDKFNIKLKTNENRIHILNNVDPIDLLLMK